VLDRVIVGDMRGQEELNHRFRILDHWLTKAQEGTDISAMLFNCSALPIIGRIQIDREVKLAGDKRNRDHGDIMFLSGKTTVDLEILEQQGKAQKERADA
jgi:hypothetical protein